MIKIENIRNLLKDKSTDRVLRMWSKVSKELRESVPTLLDELEALREAIENVDIYIHSNFNPDEHKNIYAIWSLLEDALVKSGVVEPEPCPTCLGMQEVQGGAYVPGRIPCKFCKGTGKKGASDG